MRDEFIVSLVLLSSLFVDHNSASSINSTCYFDQTIQKLTRIGDLKRENCIEIVGNVSNNEPNVGCDAPRDSRYDLFDPESNPEKFELNIGVGPSESGTTVAVLNLTISHITFNKLKIKLKNLPRDGKIYRKEIKFQDNQIPQQLSIFFGAWEYDWTEVQLFAGGSEGPQFFKEYLFISPAVEIGKLENDGIFPYVDTTSREKVYLHLPTLPEKFNTSKIEVKFRCIEPSCAENIVTANLTSDDFPFEQKEFPGKGAYDFLLGIVNNSGTEILSIPVASFCMESSQKMLLIMIVSFGAIPIVIFFALYIVYVICRRKVLHWLKSRQPNLLLVYSATHDLHIDVVINLALYLKGCQINVMMDVLDIPRENDKNPTNWCDNAFKKANTVVVISSPPGNNAIVVTKTIHRSLDNHAANLIHENRRRKDKRYLAVMLPYCEKNDVRPEARVFRLLQIPKQLHKLVNKIHHAKYTEVFDTPSEEELLESIDLAVKTIKLGQVSDEPKDSKQLIDVMSLYNNGVAIDIDHRNGIGEGSDAFMADNFTREKSKANKIQYATDITKLNLRGNEKTED